MGILLETILTVAFALFGIAVFILLAYFVILYKIEKNRNDILEMDIVGLEHYNHMLKNKLQKKKELLSIQDKLVIDKVYLALDKKTGFIYGCFTDNIRAVNYMSNTKDCMVKELEVSI